MATEIAAPKDVEDQRSPLNRSEIESIVRDILKEMGDDHVIRSKTVPSKIKNKIVGSVRQLQSVNSQGQEDHLGTIIFLRKDVAITCFHVVYRDSQIMEDLLRVDGKPLKHIVSFPYYDMSVYKCPEREGDWLELGSVSSLGEGGQLYLASYPSITSLEEDSHPIICCGNVCSMEDFTVLAQYQCFPGSSGGAILSTAGRVIGMHLESVYYQDNSFLSPPDLCYECLPCEIVRSLKWDNKATEDADFLERADSNEVAMFAAQNVSAKGHLGRFQSVSIIRAKLLEEGLLPSSSKKRHRTF